jgi:hypothetical protein
MGRKLLRLFSVTISEILERNNSTTEIEEETSPAEFSGGTAPPPRER